MKNPPSDRSIPLDRRGVSLQAWGSPCNRRLPGRGTASGREVPAQGLATPSKWRTQCKQTSGIMRGTRSRSWSSPRGGRTPRGRRRCRPPPVGPAAAWGRRRRSGSRRGTGTDGGVDRTRSAGNLGESDRLERAMNHEARIVLDLGPRPIVVDAVSVAGEGREAKEERSPHLEVDPPTPRRRGRAKWA